MRGNVEIMDEIFMCCVPLHAPCDRRLREYERKVVCLACLAILVVLICVRFLFDRENTSPGDLSDLAVASRVCSQLHPLECTATLSQRLFLESLRLRAGADMQCLHSFGRGLSATTVVSGRRANKRMAASSNASPAMP